MKKIFFVFFVIVSTTAFAQNVGIGEANPTESKLQVKTVDSAALILQNTSTALNTKTALFYKNDNNYAGSIATIQTAPGYYRMGLFTYGGAASGLKERISILDDGNVGVGTTNPTARLEVAGSLKIVDGTQGEAKILTSDAAGTASWQKASAGNGGVGYGSWGDCSTNNISEYNPVADTSFLTNAENHFGSQVSISGDYAIVGAKYDKIGANANQGSASFYQFNNGTWTLMQKITDPIGVAGDHFGCSVSISGNYAIVGSNLRTVGGNNAQGTASIYVLNGGNWVFSQRLTDPAGAATDFFGSSVSISDNYAIVGVPLDDEVLTDKGSICIYQLLAGSWIYKQKIVDAAGVANNNFGSSVSISGNFLIAGSPNDNSSKGSALIYQLSGTNWLLMNKVGNLLGISGERFGTSVSISGNYAMAGVPNRIVNGNSNQGAVTCFQLVNDNWLEIQTLNRAAGTTNDKFGEYISLSGNYAIVNASSIYGNLKNVTIYQRIGIKWQKVQEFKDPGENERNSFGAAVGIDAATKRFLVGSPYEFLSPRGNGMIIFGKINL